MLTYILYYPIDSKNKVLLNSISSFFTDTLETRQPTGTDQRIIFKFIIHCHFTLYSTYIAKLEVNKDISIYLTYHLSNLKQKYFKFDKNQ